jgi:hypothetical protein
MRRYWISFGIACWVTLGVFPLTAQAIERGVTEYTNGAQNFFCGFLPPPGFYIKNNLLTYQANEFQGVSVPAHCEAVGDAFSLVYVSKLKILGADYAVSASLPLVYFGYAVDPNRRVSDLQLRNLLPLIKGNTLTPDQIRNVIGAVPRVNDLVRLLPNLRRFLSDYQTGLGNSAISPLILGWHLGEFHVAPSFNILLPGTYHRMSLASPSQNYFTFMPAVSLSWISKCGLEGNLALMYDFPTTNPDPFPPSKESYQSGQAFHCDYCLNYAVKPFLRLGAAGYYYQQTTSDVRDDKDIGFHGRVFGLGPAIQLNLSEKLAFQLVNQWEMATLHLPEGYRVWFNVQYGF